MSAKQLYGSSGAHVERWGWEVRSILTFDLANVWLPYRKYRPEAAGLAVDLCILEACWEDFDMKGKELTFWLFDTFFGIMDWTIMAIPNHQYKGERDNRGFWTHPF